MFSKWVFPKTLHKSNLNTDDKYLIVNVKIDISLGVNRLEGKHHCKSLSMVI